MLQLLGCEGCRTGGSGDYDVRGRTIHCELLSVEATDGPAKAGSAEMPVSDALPMESDGVTMTILEALLLTVSCFSAGSACDPISSTSMYSACTVQFAWSRRSAVRMCIETRCLIPRDPTVQIHSIRTPNAVQSRRSGIRLPRLAWLFGGLCRIWT